MDFTGERFVPGLGGAQIAYEHLQRYLFAARAVVGRAVLDVGSGEGYGTFLLSRRARFAIGIDRSDEACRHATSRYADARVSFVQASATRLAFAPASFDVVVCFETIEHVSDRTAALAEMKYVLADPGVMILSTPNSREYSPHGATRNPYHEHEFDEEELTAELGRHFREVFVLGQRVTYGASMWALTARASGGRCTEVRITPEQQIVVGSPTEPPAPLYFVAVCSDQELPPGLREASFHMIDRDALVQKDFDAATAWLQERSTIAERDREHLRTVLAEREGALLESQALVLRMRIVEAGLREQLRSRRDRIARRIVRVSRAGLDRVRARTAMLVRKLGRARSRASSSAVGADGSLE